MNEHDKIGTEPEAPFWPIGAIVFAILAVVVAALALTTTASAHHPGKPAYCKWHPDLPACQNGDTPVTPSTFSRVSRILACADRPVPRLGEADGIAVNLSVDQFLAGVYAGVRFTVARYYPGVGATCERLGGSNTGKVLEEYGYPIWTR